MSDPDLERGVWAVVTIAGGRKYIGRIETVIPMDDGNDEQMKEELLQRIADGVPVQISHAFEFHSAMMPVQVGPGQTGMQRIVNCVRTSAPFPARCTNSSAMSNK